MALFPCKRYILVPFGALATLSANRSDATSAAAKDEIPHRKMKHVIVVMRHGDRAPITKSIGPNYPHTKDDEDFWSSKLISDQREKALKLVAAIQSQGTNENLYTGRDVSEIPYGMLTNLGVDQLHGNGISFRSKYCELLGFLPQTIAKENLYTRSTNTCRTMNSLRAFLVRHDTASYYICCPHFEVCSIFGIFVGKF
jgi:hypothetical protein